MQYYSFSVVLLPTLQLVFSQQIDKYTDENRPYEFGFNIDGYQHRKEKKDEKGIIKGEYGFITADGYYRVTKYETDENGNFKIISMKNYYVGFPPENPTTLPPTIFSQNISPQKIRKPNTPLLNQISDQKSLQKNGKTNVINSITTNAKPLPLFVPKTPTTTSVQYKTTTQRSPLFQGLAGCSHCIIPTTKAPLKSDPQKYSVDYRIDLNLVETTSENPKGRHQSDRPAPEKSVHINEPNFKQKENNFGSFKNFSTNNDAKSTNRPIEFNNHNSPKVETNFNVNGLPLSFNNENNKNQQQQQQHAGDIFNSNNNTSPEKVRLQLSNEEPNTTNTISPGKSQIPPVNKLTEFEKNSVPNAALMPELDRKRKLNNGLDTSNKLLYTFNYTVDFHGHHEDGFRDGAKEGDYFAGSKDGVQRKVNYLANEFGYQPNITLSDLDENDTRKINEGNEKHTGLKGYEFKWFYRK